MTRQRGKSIARSQKEKYTVYINWLDVIGPAAAAAVATFVVAWIIAMVPLFVLIGWAQGDIMKKNQDKVLTRTMVERELIIQHPRIYNAFVSLPAFCLSLGLVTFIVAILWQLAQRF